MKQAPVATIALMLTSLVVGAGASWLVFRAGSGDKVELKPADKPIQKDATGYWKVNTATAAAFGIETAEVKEASWHPRLLVDGRVVPNPQASLEVRVPFAGILTGDTLFQIGTVVKAEQTLATIEARFSAVEKLDLRAKSAEAEDRQKSAEEVLRIKEERLRRLEGAGAGSIPPATVEDARIQVAEARMLKNVALAQGNIWKQALAATGKKNVVVPLQAPMAGEIVEVGAQPGMVVEPGQLVLRLADFRRVLVRLDFPVTSQGPPAELDVETPAAPHEPPVPWRAKLRGSAPAVEIGLQKAGYLYEVMPSATALVPNWRPGLYVRSNLPDPSKTVQPARVLPASALLVHLGATWVYVRRGEDRYKRQEVEVLGRDRDILYVADRGWEDSIVVSRGAQALLAAEFLKEADDD